MRAWERQSRVTNKTTDLRCCPVGASSPTSFSWERLLSSGPISHNGINFVGFLWAGGWRGKFNGLFCVLGNLATNDISQQGVQHHWGSLLKSVEDVTWILNVLFKLLDQKMKLLLCVVWLLTLFLPALHSEPPCCSFFYLFDFFSE